MVSSRLATAAAGIVLSLAASAALWWYFDVALFFLAVPFVPFLFRGRGGSDDRSPVRTCPECGFSTRNPSVQHCPRDGARLRAD